MGRSIDVSVYNTKELVQKLQEWGAHDIDLLVAIDYAYQERVAIMMYDGMIEEGIAKIIAK
jgi:hypothetical protein